MGMSSDEFWESTAKEFFLRLSAFFEYQTFLQNQEWTRTRWQTTILVNLQLPKNKKIKPVDLFEFEWEKAPEDTEKMSPEVMEKLIAKWDAEAAERKKNKK